MCLLLFTTTIKNMDFSKFNLDTDGNHIFSASNPNPFKSLKELIPLINILVTNNLGWLGQLYIYQTLRDHVRRRQWKSFFDEITEKLPFSICFTVRELLKYNHLYSECLTSEQGTFIIYSRCCSAENKRKEIYDELNNLFDKSKTAEIYAQEFDNKLMEYANSDLHFAYMYYIFFNMQKKSESLVGLRDKILRMRIHIDHTNDETKNFMLAKSVIQFLNELRNKFNNLSSRFTAIDRIKRTIQNPSNIDLTSVIWNSDLKDLNLVELKDVIDHNIRCIDCGKYILVIIFGKQNLHYILGRNNCITRNITDYADHGFRLDPELSDVLYTVYKNYKRTDNILANVNTRLTLPFIITALISSVRSSQINMFCMQFILQYVKLPCDVNYVELVNKTINYVYRQ